MTKHAAEKHPRVAVIVLNWDGKQFLKECMESLLKQTYKNYIVYFVDNGSSDGSVEYVRQNFKHRLIKIISLEKNLGFAEGNNVGIREAFRDKSVKFVIILNNDTYVEKTFVEEFVNGSQHHPDSGSFASRIMMYSNKSLIDSAGIVFYKNCMPSGRGAGKPFSQYMEEVEVFGAHGAGAMYSRKMLEDVAPDGNYYDPEFFIYQEEFDLSWRAKLKGWKCHYMPHAVIYHIGSGVMRKFSKRAKYLLERNRIWSLSKNMNGSVMRYSLPHIIIYEIITLPLYVFGGYLPAVIKGRFDGIKGIKKFRKKKTAIRVSNLEQIKWMEDRKYIETFRQNFSGGAG